MKNILYYVVDLSTRNYDGFDEVEGKDITLYVIVDNKPKAVIAVACERDLTSGVREVNKIPVLGIFNSRPNGPCIDTNIKINEVEDAINFFTCK